MAKGYEKAKGRKGGKFVSLPHSLLYSAAWRGLSTDARAIWLEIMGRFNGNNNGQISLSCREAGEFCKISKNTAGKALKELQEKGFISIEQYSSFTCKMKRATRWRLTHMTCEGKAPTGEWRDWKHNNTQ